MGRWRATLAIFAVTGLLLHSSTALAANCELRVFPTDQVSVVTKFENYGLFGAVLGGREQPKDIFLRDLPGDAQTEAVSGIANLTALLGLPESDIVRERSPISFAVAKKNKERLTASQAQCYAELVIVSLMYTSNVVNGRRIGALAVLRRFDGPNSQPRIQQLGGSGVLTLYPVKDVDRHEAAIADLTAAFQTAIVEGARKFVR